MRSQIGASNNIFRCGFMSDAHSYASNLELYFSLIGKVNRHISCGDAVGDLEGIKETIDILDKLVGAENCVIGDHDEAILQEPIADSYLFDREGEIYKNLLKTNSKKAKKYFDGLDNRCKKYCSKLVIREQLTEEELDFLRCQKKAGSFTINDVKITYAHDKCPDPDETYYVGKTKKNRKKVNDPLHIMTNFGLMETDDIDFLFLGHSHIPYIASLSKNGLLSVRYVRENDNGHGKIIFDDDHKYICGLGAISGITYPIETNGKRITPPFDMTKISYAELTADSDNDYLSVQLSVKSIFN